MMGSDSAGASPALIASSCTARSSASNSTCISSFSFPAWMRSAAAAAASFAAGTPTPAVFASEIFALRSSFSTARFCAMENVWYALDHSFNEHITIPMRASPMPHRGPPSFNAVSASTAAAELFPTRMRASARLASMAGRHAANGLDASSISSISSAKVYSSSAPAKSPHQQKMLAMQRQILACSSGESASMFTASNARSSHVESSGIGSPSWRFLANSDMARSVKCSFSVYSSVVMSFARSCSSSHASVASLFSTASTTATSTPCGHAFLRKPYQSCALTQSSPVASHSLSICSSDISNTLPPLLLAPLSFGVPLGPSVGVAPVGVKPSGVITVFLMRSSPLATATDFGSS